jgi:septum formation protein
MPALAGELELLLASTSASRRALLDALGLPYRAVAPDYEERLDAAPEPGKLVRTLALGKARAVARRFPQARVIGADQVMVFEGRVWGKPVDEAAARDQLQRLNGCTHELHTGVALLAPGLERVEHEVVRLTAFHLAPHEIEGYLATREWEGCAGSYRIEGRGLGLFARVEGDLNTVRGLPMTRLVGMLREAGVRFFDR